MRSVSDQALDGQGHDPPCQAAYALNLISPFAKSTVPSALDRVHPLKPDNAGGGKGPQFKTGAIRSEGPGDWATYQLR